MLFASITRRCIKLSYTSNTFRPFFVMGNKASSEAVAKPMNIFDHTVEDIEGNPFPLEQVRGAKGYLVVNVASA